MKTTETVEKPVAKLLGKDGNVFNLMGICSQTLKKAGQGHKSKEMIGRVVTSKSYTEALSVMGEYVKIR